MRRHNGRNKGFGRGNGGHGAGWRQTGWGQRVTDMGEDMGQRMAARGLYRSRNGRLLGVCRGIAEYMDFKVSTVRILTFIAFLFTGIWPVGILYLVAAALMKQEPAGLYEGAGESESYEGPIGPRSSTLSRLKRRFDGLDKRIQRMEDVVTSKDFQWEQKMNG